jgi:hypothetical protein
LLGYEHRRQPVATRRVFLRRLGWNVLVAAVLFAVSLVAGMAGYVAFEGMNWLEAYDNAAMILSGMGPYKEPASAAGKLFAGTYALYCGFLIAGATALVLAPIFHRILHTFHVEDEADERRDEGSGRR